MTVAVLDACVLYPPSLRDLLMRLASSGIYSPRWTKMIEAEWVRNVLADNPEVTADPGKFLLTMRRHRAALKSPLKTVDEYINTLNTNGLYELASRIGNYRDVI